MALTFVAHNTPEPALYGAMASILADLRQQALAHLPVQWDRQRYADACQHVIAQGELVTSGLLWRERISGISAGKVWRLDELLSQHGDKDWVIPLGPAQLATFSRLAREVRDFGVDYELIQVDRAHQGYQFSRLTHDKGTQAYWWRDRFGRWSANQAILPPVVSGRPLRIALIGSHQDQAESYPATLAALGDAADALAVELDMLYLSPQTLDGSLHHLLRDIDGVLLPGGSDMRNVAGQIAVAHYCLSHAVPVLGLCLGMQTMATAVIQQMSGSDRANLAEADPLAPVKTFVPLSETPGHPVHRLGDRLMKMRAGTQLAAILGEEFTLRYNHRFHLNPLFKEDLHAFGLTIAASDLSGTIADGIEHSAHPFYIGVQGHPELSSSPQRPHPLITAFLQAAEKG
ncbi:MAG: gamma-glutamyl-gamma-aminobutyrate hydrolase family protein [Rouxiella aceris]|uniref:glutamine amidotransferase-related protein n=1 Tax=Rouxiella aceris TaxID=2703884 RepID=UPI0028412F10|nr:gamma-glutamyl-gamma-aminobutyrate hydrolase family protein [Rouxiella aceris]MDR3430914.1 gamma-glutamyl-gamma-aminobutyrate hydrolase family protein [Rouxiella aceris]